MSRIVLLDPKLTPMSISAIFKQRKIFPFSKFWGHLNEKKAAATPLINQFAKIWSEHVLKIKTKIHKVWASGKCHFLPGGGLLKIGGIRYFFRSKGGSFIFFKRNKIFCQTFQVPEKAIVRCNSGTKTPMGLFKRM